MRVRCLRILSPLNGEEISHHPSMTIGEEYVVVSIMHARNRAADLQLSYGLDMAPAYWPAAMFEVVDDRLPSTWAVTISQHGYVETGPRSCLGLDFWERYHNGYPDDIDTYRRELRVLLEEDARPVPPRSAADAS